MANVEIRKNSWLNFADLLEFNGCIFWDTPNFPKIPPEEADTFIEVDDQIAGNLDLIAHEEYGDHDLWWVIALANGMDLIPTDVLIGSRIRIPNKALVDKIISKGQQK